MTTATQQTHLDVNHRHDFVMLFDVTDGNPNGDPDAGNLPRLDPETMQGLVTDVALKRKVRDWVDLTRGQEGRFKIYVQHRGAALNALHRRAYEELGIKSTGSKQKREDVDRAQKWMCANFYDVRIFGAVMTTGVNCGQVRGPIQLTFARSVDPVVPLDLSITRVAVTREDEAGYLSGDGEGEKAGGKETEMGRKAIVPYGLYRAHGFFNSHFAAQSGADREDLGLFWQALQMMWDADRSSARGMMACRGIYVFSHDSRLGNAPAASLFDRVTVSRREGVETPRTFADYQVIVSEDQIPNGVELTCLVG
ncbi:MAG: type I-C CRISPR-associated protein Cas7/Csd2 [Chloroflexota bacterium]|nr:type I-C CRISPR-associated protein Cas7/Csd2 [Chloroflexota bacterium]